MLQETRKLYRGRAKSCWVELRPQVVRWTGSATVNATKEEFMGIALGRAANKNADCGTGLFGNQLDERQKHLSDMFAGTEDS